MTPGAFVARYALLIPRDQRAGFREDLHRLMEHERQIERRRLTTDAAYLDVARALTAQENRRAGLRVVTFTSTGGTA